MRLQRTLKTTVECEGVGIHTGEAVKMRITPAPAHAGIVFVRKDLDGEPRVPARCGNVVGTDRRTVIGARDARISTVEHLMAAFYVAGVDNAVVELWGPEVPDLDGACAGLYNLLRSAGTREQAAVARRFRVARAARVDDGDAWIEAEPADALEVVYELRYEKEGLAARVECGPDDFARHAGSRTFCLEDEVETLLKAGYGRGARKDSVLVLGRKSTRETVEEAAGHKILDFLGDLALVGGRVTGRFVCHRSGHAQNRRMAQMVSEESTPQEGAFEVTDIMEVLPHRFPFLMVDRVLKMEGDERAVGVKNVTINEAHFVGHFPGQPVMPGVLQIEAMAQLAGVLLMRNMKTADKLPFLMSIDGVKFRRAVVPGDQLVLEAEVVRARGRSGEVRTRALVDGKVASQAVIRFMLVDRRPAQSNEE